jgi:hypothetical protein
MSETAQAYQWVASTMAADSALVAAATGGIYREYAPIDTVPPFVIVQQQAGTDMLTVNAVRLFVHLLVQIKALGPSGIGGNYGALVTIADRIDALFKSVRDVGLSGSGGVLCCYREQTVAYGELINGTPWSHLGGLYHIQLQGS